MGIRFHCPYCRKKLNVKAFLAGKRGICPYCDSGLDIPLESEPRNGKGKLPTESVVVQTVPRESDAGLAGPAAEMASESGIAETPAADSAGESSSDASAAPAAAPAPSATPAAGPESNGPDAIDENPDAVWYVRPPSGGQFGPAKGDVMRKWLDEGRVSPDSLVWREGWADWQEAEPTFPALSKRSTPPPPPSSSSPPTPSSPAAAVPAKTVAQPGPSQAVAVASPAARVVAESPAPAEAQPIQDTTATKAMARRRSNLPALIAVSVLVVVSIGLLVGLIVALSG